MLQPKLRTKTGVPYGGLYSINVPEKGLVGTSSNFEGLLRVVTDYRKANGMPVGLGLEEQLEREICLMYSKECQDTDPRVPSAGKLTWTDVLNGTQVFMKWKAAGSPLVPQEEANRRAEICAKCSFNSDFTKPCGGLCGALKALVVELAGKLTTPFDSRLKSCRICRCFCAVTVHVPLAFQTDYLTETQKAQFRYAKETNGCWKVEGL